MYTWQSFHTCIDLLIVAHLLFADLIDAWIDVEVKCFVPYIHMWSCFTTCHCICVHIPLYVLSLACLCVYVHIK